MADELTLEWPKGPRRPIIEALDENEILTGWVGHLESGSALQAQRFRTHGGERVDDDERTREYYQGLDGETWALDHLVTEHFPNLLRAAAFLAIWGAFEGHLTRLCKEVADARGYQVTLADLSGRGISRIRAYLVKVAGLDGDWARDQFKEILELQKIRNLFAHDDGRVTAGQREQQEYARNHAHLAIDGGAVILMPTFLRFILERHRLFLLSLKESIDSSF